MIKFHPSLGLKSKIFMRLFLKKKSPQLYLIFLRSGQTLDFGLQMEASGPDAHDTKQREGAWYIHLNMQPCSVILKTPLKHQWKGKPSPQ